ncbi:MAG: SMP-30/gluconolactonase/LRE family protein, partial [Cyclobacteriaceae bacterium]
DQQRLYQCEHGNRQLVRIVSDTVEVLASHYNGKRLNSPNDLVLANNGAVYFTDPPWGLPKNQNDPAKELDFNGVYKYQDDSLVLLIDSLSWPNGIALSPDEKFLYVGSFQQEAPRWFRYELDENGVPISGSLFFDASEYGNNHPDGIAVDEKGNLYCTGPQGVLVLAPEGDLLGIIKPDELPANCAIGGPGNKTLYITARKGLYAIALKNAGL